jgi:hypothetical protein
MRNYDGIFEIRPSLIGTLSTISGTAIGAPINVQGFRDVLGILVAGALAGSTGSTVNLAVKIQESSTPTGTGANWTDITNNAYNQGSFNFTTLTFGDTTGTHIPYAMGKAFCVLKDGNRKQYIRAHATLSGTVGLGPKFSVTFMLGRPDDTLYVNNAVTVPSGNVELTKLL